MRPSTDILLKTLKQRGILVLSSEQNKVRIAPDYEIEIEPNGMYKLLDAGYIVAPFPDLDSLCAFLLRAGAGR